jgi:hypothetical protein
VRLRLVTSQGSPYPSRSPRAHPSGWFASVLLAASLRALQLYSLLALSKSRLRAFLQRPCINSHRRKLLTRSRAPA